MDFKKILSNIVIIFLSVVLSVIAVIFVLKYQDKIANFIFKAPESAPIISRDSSMAKQEGLEKMAVVRQKTDQCLAKFDLEKIPLPDRLREKEELAQYALCRAKTLQLRSECSILSSVNKDVCENDVNDFVFTTSLIELFMEDEKKNVTCGQEAMKKCNDLFSGLTSDDFVVSDSAKGRFCENACSSFKAKSATDFAVNIHNTFERKTVTSTPSESLEKTKRDIAALFSFDANKCDTSVGDGVDCKNEIFYLSAKKFDSKETCNKMIDAGGVMKEVFKGVCFAQFENDKTGYCDVYLNNYKYNYCTEKSLAQ